MNTMIALTGLGYDIHRFAEAPRPLMLGGVHSLRQGTGRPFRCGCPVPCRCGRPAGRRRLPDIGFWFPPGDPACKDISSLDIVAKAVSLIRERGGRVVNVDSS